MTDFERMSRDERVAAARGLEAARKRLPRVSGRAVLGATKADPGLRPIPVLVLTTSSAQRDIAKSYDLRADQFVTRPMGLNVLAGELRIEGLAARGRQ
jgi:two-component system response regulator